MTIDLNPEQLETLSQTVEAKLVALRFEIAHTDHRDFKAMLVRRGEVLESTLAALKRPH
jgi:hypothetical protein